MWQRFTEKARKVIFYAQEEAQRFGEGYVSTEHILLGLLRDRDHSGARTLLALDVNLEELQANIERHLPRGDARPNQDMTLTPRAKRVIDLAYDEARDLRNDFIGTEHLLLGLRREGDGLAGRALASSGVQMESLREAVRKIHEEDGVQPTLDEEKPRPSAVERDSNWQRRLVMRRVREWARWASNISEEPGSHQEDLDNLSKQLNETMSSMQQSLLLGLCLEVANGGNLQEAENWKKLRLTPEQVSAIAEIGTEIRKLLTSE